MDRRLQKQIDALSGAQFNIQPSQRKNIQALIVLFEGTAKTGQTGAVSDCGSLRITNDGDGTHNVDYDALADVGDINFGSNLLSSAEAGAFTASVVVPFYEPSFEQALSITDESQLNVQHVPGDEGTVFESLTAKVYAVYTDLPELGIYRMLRDNQNETGSIDSKPFSLNRRNVTSIFLKDVDDSITAVQLTQDGENILSPQPFVLLEVGTLYENSLETTTFDRVKIETHTPGIAGSTINRNTEIAFTTDDDAKIEMLVCSMEWH